MAGSRSTNDPFNRVAVRASMIAWGIFTLIGL
jgi:hypothetical protein